VESRRSLDGGMHLFKKALMLGDGGMGNIGRFPASRLRVVSVLPFALRNGLSFVPVISNGLGTGRWPQESPGLLGISVGINGQ
jgi:hypothetical protein